jgi:hypothetical protein
LLKEALHLTQTISVNQEAVVGEEPHVADRSPGRVSFGAADTRLKPPPMTTISVAASLAQYVGCSVGLMLRPATATSS